MSADKDFHYMFFLSRQCLRLLGIWPDPHTSLNDTYLPKLRYITAICFLNIFVCIPQLTNVIHSWGNVALLVQNIAPMNFSLLALCKLITTRYYGETLRTLMISVLDDWTISKETSERDTMLKFTRRGRSLSLKCYLISAVTVVFYLLFNIQKLYRTLHQPNRRLPYPFNYPYNSQKSPNYEITYIIQMISGISTTLMNSSIDSFISILLLHISAQLINLRKTLNNLVEKITEKSVSSLTFRKSLIAIVVRHQNLIRNAETIDNCYSVSLFIHMIATTFQLCFKTFQVFVMIADENVKTSIIAILFPALYTVTMLLHLWIYCYAANKLMTESIGVGYGVYECNWYNLLPKDAKDLIFIARRSMTPLLLTAGKFGTFSVEMFGTTVKTAMGYLSVLLTIRD